MRSKPSAEQAKQLRERDLVAARTEDLLGKKPKKRSAGISDRVFLKVLDEVGTMLADGKWEQATGRHFVALYADLHFRVYGVEAIDLDSKQRLAATSMARSMLAKEFAGSATKMSMFVRWAWSREKGREEWRRANSGKGSRLTWRFQFGRALLTEYRLEEARKATKR